MAMTQKVTITDNSGGTHATHEDLMDKLASDVSTIDTVVAKIKECTAEGTLVSNTEFSDSGKSAVITRVWDDASWAEFEVLGGANDSDYSDAGWTVVSENSTHMGLRTRQDETFGE
jgi:hypothetical protein